MAASTVADKLAAAYESALASTLLRDWARADASLAKAQGLVQGSPRSDERATRAAILINYHGIRQGFTTENAKREPAEILIRLVEGPFRSLDGCWRFTGLAGRGCKVELSLRYEFSSRILEKLVGPVFNPIANTLVDAFAKRAEQVYGSNSVSGDQQPVKE